MPNGQTPAIVNAPSIAAQLSCTRVHISWGKCGVPRAVKQRRFLGILAEEVAVQEGFEHAKSVILYSPGSYSFFFFGLIALFRSTVHSGTCKGTKADAQHWVGEFSTASGPRMIKAHIYVLPGKQRGKWLKHLGKYERSALGEIIYQEEWKPGVKHVQRYSKSAITT